MLVGVQNFLEVLDEIKAHSTIAIDCETTGLNLYKEDRMFALVIATPKAEYYFNFNSRSICGSDFLLGPRYLPLIEEVLNTRLLLIGHNIKFDLTALYASGMNIYTPLWCTMIGARIENNEHLSYSLDECAKRIGLAKDNTVEEYIKENELYETRQTNLKKKIKIKFFDRVPLTIMQPYAEKDARLAYDLFLHQAREIQKLDNIANAKSVMNVVMNEMRLIHTVFNMEKVGIKIDGEYAKKGYEYEKEKYEEAAKECERISGQPFVDSNKSIANDFGLLGIEALGGKTPKGNPSFTDNILQGVAHPYAKAVLAYREHYKKATFYQGLIDVSDANWTVHPNFKQAGTATGRFSCDSPNLQQIPKEEQNTFSVRGCFKPREDFTFVEFDFQAMEYRLFADYAGETQLIDKINSGHDVHQATADIIGTDRKRAKTVNFLLLYGGGAAKLASQLGISLEESKSLRSQYFAALPKISQFLRNVLNQAERRGWIFNWFGRRLRFPNPDFAYKACNYLIQGGSADVMKIAMNRCDDLLQTKKSRLILQVHDSLLFEIHKDEVFLEDQIKEIMENVWQGKIKLTVDKQRSEKSWQEMS